MTKTIAAVRSMRLRTLPLSLSGVLLGILLAVADYHVKPLTIVFIVLTTLSLQILSNLSNELGDVLHGTDRDDRQGPQYGGLDKGVLTVSEMKMIIGAFIFLSVVFGLLMIWVSFGTFLSYEAMFLMILGAAAIIASMKYTLGKSPYGYRGLGDLFVFTFFGIISVLGAYFVSAHTIHGFLLLLPAVSIGCFSVGVLNVNNIRDMKSDSVTRVTVAIKLGLKKARIYQTALIVIGWAAAITYCFLRVWDPWHYLFLLTLPLFVIHLRGVWTRQDKSLDPMLPLLVMSSLAFSLLFGLGFLVYLM